MNTKELTRKAREAVVDVFYEYAEVYVFVAGSALSSDTGMPSSDITRLARLAALEDGLSEAARIIQTAPFLRRTDGERSPTDPGAHQWLRTLLTDITEMSNADTLPPEQEQRIRELLRVLESLLNRTTQQIYPS